MIEAEIRGQLEELRQQEELLKAQYGVLQNEILRLKRFQKEARVVQSQLQEVWSQQDELRKQMFRVAVEGIETPFGPIMVQ